MKRKKAEKLVVLPHKPGKNWLNALLIATLWIASVGGAWVFSAMKSAPRLADTKARIANLESKSANCESTLELAEKNAAISKTADQVSRTANQSLEQTIRGNEEELARLRADLAFFQRLVGDKSQKEGLAPHQFKLKTIANSNAYDFELILTQNIKKGVIISGSAEIAIEGVRNNKLVVLRWRDLVSPEQRAEPLDFSFKYFQRLTGNFVLPTDFTPDKIRIEARSDGGEHAKRIFAWTDAISMGNEDNVREQ